MMSGRKPHLPTKPAFRERHAVLEASTCDESKSKILSLVLMMRLCATSILSYALMSGSISSPWFYSTLVKTRAVFRPYPLTSSGQRCPCCVLLYKKPFSTEFHRFFSPLYSEMHPLISQTSQGNSRKTCRIACTEQSRCPLCLCIQVLHYCLYYLASSYSLVV